MNIFMANEIVYSIIKAVLPYKNKEESLSKFFDRQEDYIKKYMPVVADANFVAVEYRIRNGR